MWWRDVIIVVLFAAAVYGFIVLVSSGRAASPDAARARRLAVGTPAAR